MGKPLSTGLRSRAPAAVSEGMSCQAAAVRFRLAAVTMIRWYHQLRRTGTYAAKPQGGARLQLQRAQLPQVFGHLG